ncbi:MAG: GldG family protein [Deltaproteobacteria bacterium]|nr:GldG family protein [Deltaproteobacteria bacterium]
MSISSKKRSYASNAILYTLFVVGALVLVNLIGTRLFGRLDLTEKRIYTLSKSSKDLVKALPDYLSVKAFISKDLPPEIKRLSRDVRDKLDDYQSASNGRFRWEAVDPAADKKYEEEASRCKVNKVQIQKLSNSKFELGAYYLGLCLQYGDKTEAIPQIVSDAGLEFQLSSLIKKLTVKKKKIALTTGHGEFDFNQGLQAIKQDFEQEYDTTTVNPSSAEIGADIDALIVAGPRQPIDEKGQREIDRFLMTGKGAVILAPGMVAQGAGARGMESIKMLQSNDNGLGKILESYGFKIGQEIVVDPPAAAPGVMDVGGGRRALLTMPAFVAAATEKAPGLSVLEGVRGLVFPFASAVDLVGPLAGGTVPAGAKLWKLAGSSPNSFKHSGFAMVSPEMKFDGAGKENKSYAFGYAYQGKLKSAFVTEPAASVSTEEEKKPLAETEKPVRLVVIGNAAFASDEWSQLARFMPVFAAGAQLLYNAIGWTVEDEALIPLRSKTMDSRALPAMSERKATVIRWVNILGLPVAFCLFGVARWRVRRANRKNQRF